MDAALWVGIGALALVGLGIAGFFCLLAFGVWQHYREGRKEHRAADLSDREGE